MQGNSEVNYTYNKYSSIYITPKTDFVIIVMQLFTYLVRQAQASCDHSVLLCPWATFAGGEWALVTKNDIYINRTCQTTTKSQPLTRNIHFHYKKINNNLSVEHI